MWSNSGLFLRKDDSVVPDYWGYPCPGDGTSACSIRLNKGWNKMLVKCANWEGGFGFRVRIADPDRKLKYAVEEPEELKKPQVFAPPLPASAGVNSRSSPSSARRQVVRP